MHGTALLTKSEVPSKDQDCYWRASVPSQLSLPLYSLEWSASRWLRGAVGDLAGAEPSIAAAGIGDAGPGGLRLAGVPRPVRRRMSPGGMARQMARALGRSA